MVYRRSARDRGGFIQRRHLTGRGPERTGRRFLYGSIRLAVSVLLYRQPRICLGSNMVAHLSAAGVPPLAVRSGGP